VPGTSFPIFPTRCELSTAVFRPFGSSGVAGFLQSIGPIMRAEERWAIVLAGGAGRRVSVMTGGVPKQFWAPGGGATLLTETLGRLDPLVPADRRLLLVHRDHRPYLRESPCPVRSVMYQPSDRGTATAVLLGLLPILERNPDATVVLSPADHGVANPAQFRDGLMRAVRAVDRRRTDLVLVGAQPDHPETSYGWITPGRRIAAGLFRVTAFVEKPARETAAALLAAGSVWNTMVLAARASALFDLMRERQPRLTSALAAAWHLASGSRAEAMADVYQRVPSADLSRDVLTGARGLGLCVWPTATGWSDLGSPDRLETWLRHAGAARSQPASCSAGAA
jgi:mannose-1-phosphate guanylyltransferase